MTTQAFNLSQFANYLNASGQVSAAGIQSGVTLPSGTVGLYYQASAPTGWTQVTTLNDYALRIVNTSGGGTGGTTAFSSVFTNQTPTISGGTLTASIGATTLSVSQMPSHTHSANSNGGGSPNFAGIANGGPGVAYGSGCQYSIYQSGDTQAQGGGSSHTHSFSGSVSAITSSAITLNVRYANIILCSKN